MNYQREAENVRIALDLDDVLTDLLGAMLQFYNREYEANAAKQDIRDWDFFPEEMHHAFKEAGGYNKLQLLPDSRELVRWLMERAEIYIVTFRSPSFASETLTWLKQHLPEVAHRERVFFTDGPKVETCRQLGVHALVDDSTRHTLEVADNLQILAVLMKNGTRMHENMPKHPRILQAENIQEVQKQLENTDLL